MVGGLLFRRAGRPGSSSGGTPASTHPPHDFGMMTVTRPTVRVSTGVLPFFFRGSSSCWAGVLATCCCASLPAWAPADWLATVAVAGARVDWAAPPPTLTALPRRL